MPAVTSVPRSWIGDIDGLIIDEKWAVTSLTYSFPASGALYGVNYSPDNEPANHFEALNSVQRAVVRTALAGYASVTGLTFTEVTESSSLHGDLRVAESDAPDTAWSYYPDPSPAGGDAWFNSSTGDFDNPVKGNHAYYGFIHELGHNLGLEHGHDWDDGDAMMSFRDSMENSVMSYRSYWSQVLDRGYTNETWGFAQTLMQADIAALQYLYGANYATNAGNTTYAWSPTTGEFFINGAGQGAPGANRVFMTVWDGGGIDTYDFSNYSTAVSASLYPGSWTTTSQTQRVYLGDGNYAIGTVANALLHNDDPRSLIENLYGGQGDDILGGNQAANTIDGGAGNDSIGGGGGGDTVRGGDGDDTLQPGLTGVDFLDGGAGSDTLSFQQGYLPARVNLVAAGREVQVPDHTGAWRDAADLVNVENIVGSLYRDFLSGDGNVNRISADYGDDTLSGGGVASGVYGEYDFLDGGEGTDTVEFTGLGAAVWVDLGFWGVRGWTSGAASMSAGTHRPIADIANVENVVATEFADELYGDGKWNRIDGAAGDDTLDGAGDNDTLLGGDGNDTLRTGAGLDSLDGGAGTDTVDFLGFGSAVSVNLLSAAYEAQTRDTPTLNAGTWRNVADIVNVENITGSQYDDYLSGSGGANTISGRGGDDILIGADVGSGARDVLDGGAGNDTVDFSAFGAAVWIDLGYAGPNGRTRDSATLIAGTWRDIADITGVENIIGSAFADELHGDGNPNRLDGAQGADFMSGGAGDDVYLADNAGDAVTEALGAGVDTVHATVTYVAHANVDNIVLAGTAVAATGNGLNNSIVGNGVANTLNGGAGNDVLDGLGGMDTAEFSLARSAYTVTQVGRIVTVNGPDGVDSLLRIERLQFADVLETLVYQLADQTADANGDGNSDVLWRSTDGRVVTYEMHGRSQTTTVVGAEPLNWNIVDAHGDYNGDGKSDILWRSSDGTVVTWEMQGGAQHTRSVIDVEPANWHIIDGHGDYNGDGKSEVLWRSNDGRVATLEVNGITTVVGAEVPSWNIIDTHGDYNGDGKSDILWRHLDGRIMTWEMDGKQHTSAIISVEPSTWQIIDGHADYNGDGQSDILLRSIDGRVVTWQMTGGAQHTETMVGFETPSWRIIDTHGDYNGDGKSDILWRNADGRISTWEMQGGAQHTTTLVGIEPSNWIIIDGHGDYNGDGQSDILWRSTDGRVATYEMNGTAQPITTVVGSEPWHWNIIDGAERGASIAGDGADNILSGTVGRDLLYGADGNDTLTGGGGSDVFAYKAVTDSGTAGDVISDFSKGEGDVLDLREMLQTFSGYNGANAFSGGYLQFTASGSDTLLRVDSNGGANSLATLATLTNTVLQQSDTLSYVV